MGALSFGQELDDEQKEVAKKVYDRAVAMGVDPRIALSVAYQESKFRPNVGKSSKGAIGIMQVMPKTGKEFGFSKEDLLNPDSNIDAGLTVLKNYMDKFPDDPRLGVVAYNAGPNHSFFKGGDLPKETENYLRAMQDYGAFSGGQPAAPVAEEPAAEEPVEKFDFSAVQKPAEMPTPIDEQEIRQAQIYGGSAGAGISSLRSAKDFIGSLRTPQGSGPGVPAPAAPPAMPGVPQPPVSPLGASQMPAGSMGPLQTPSSAGQPVGGSGTANWGKKFGLQEIEANRATGMGNMPGSADELIKERAAALQRLQKMAPATGMAEDPTRGGLMVPQANRYTGPRGPQGQIGGAKPPPVMPNIPQPTVLEEVTSLLKRLAATPILRYAAPPVVGALSAGEANRAFQQARGPKPDYTGAALSGVGALGGAMSLFPATAPIGIPLGLGAGAAQAIRERMKENEDIGYGPDVGATNPMGDYGF